MGLPDCGVGGGLCGALLAIRSLMNYVKRHNFSAFGIYRILLGIIVLVVYFVTK